MKRILSFILALTMAITLALLAFAEEDVFLEPAEEEEFVPEEPSLLANKNDWLIPPVEEPAEEIPSYDEEEPGETAPVYAGTSDEPLPIDGTPTNIEVKFI